MNRSRMLPLLALVAMFQPVVCHAQEEAPKPAKAAAKAPQAVAITSQLSGTIAGGGAVRLTLSGVGVHTLTGLSVLFTAKQLVAVNPPGEIGPLTVTLNPLHRSVGALKSRKFPTEHRQNFFLQINSERLGTLVSDAPVTLSARIESSPPTATYKSVSKDVGFYKQGDPGKKPVLTVTEVSSEVKPAASATVRIKSRVTAAVGDKKVELQLVGTASKVSSGTSVLFTRKALVSVNPPPEIGRLAVTLNPQHASVGTLASESFPTEHQQNFFLQIQNKRLGTLISDEPVTLSARIESSPPTATYKLTGKPVAFYKKGDREKKTVLTFETVESDVSPAKRDRD
jgi:hypothetical protein